VNQESGDPEIPVMSWENARDKRMIFSNRRQVGRVTPVRAVIQFATGSGVPRSIGTRATLNRFG
jgi:hypothetical protein